MSKKNTVAQTETSYLKEDIDRLGEINTVKLDQMEADRKAKIKKINESRGRPIDRILKELGIYL